METTYNFILLFLLVLTGAALVLVTRAERALGVLAAQYFLLTLFLAQIVALPVAMVRVISGSLVALIFLVTIRHLPASAAPRGAPNHAFRLIALALVAVCVASITSSIPFLNLPNHIFFGTVWLVALGLLISILARQMLAFGIGILVFTAGFGILQMAMEGSLFLYGLLNIADVFIALVVAHLVLLPPIVQGGRRRGESL